MNTIDLTEDDYAERRVAQDEPAESDAPSPNPGRKMLEDLALLIEEHEKYRDSRDRLIEDLCKIAVKIGSATMSTQSVLARVEQLRGLEANAQAEVAGAVASLRAGDEDTSKRLMAQVLHQNETIERLEIELAMLRAPAKAIASRLRQVGRVAKMIIGRDP